jgi:hypothetical protein
MTMKNTTHAAFRQSRAITLVEVLVTVAIATMVLMGVGVFLFSGLKSYNSDFNRLNVNNDLRRFTLSMETDAAFANTFYIYDQATNGAPALNGLGVDNYVTPGESGDLVLLVSILTSTTGATTVNQIVAYYHNGAVANTGPIYRYSTGTGLGAAGTTPIYTLYNNFVAAPLNAIIAAQQQFMPTATVVGVAQNSAGSPPAAHPNLFYYLWRPGTGNGAFMVQSQIKEQQNNQTVLAIDTYNFTIWPRS